MNYSELSEIYKEDITNHNFSYYLNSNNPQLILEEYELLNKSLDEYKKKHEDLQANNNYFNNYIYNSKNNHYNVVNIINDFSITSNFSNNNHDNIYDNNNDNNNELTKLYVDYNNKIKENYAKWVTNHYTPQLMSIENNIEVIEDKISDFRNLFIYIINKILKTSEINDGSNKKICPICFVNEVNMCMNPCGHTICNNCVISTRNPYLTNKCFSCRTEVKDYIKMYFSI